MFLCYNRISWRFLIGMIQPVSLKDCAKPIVMEEKSPVSGLASLLPWRLSLPMGAREGCMVMGSASTLRVNSVNLTGLVSLLPPQLARPQESSSTILWTKNTELTPINNQMNKLKLVSLLWEERTFPSGPFPAVAALGKGKLGDHPGPHTLGGSKILQQHWIFLLSLLH